MLKNICVSIAEKTYYDIIKVLADYNFAEIRLDFSEMNNEEIYKIFNTPNKQLIATCKPGNYSKEERITKLITAIKAGANYVDIEVEESVNYKQVILEQANLHKCKPILSYHNFEQTPKIEELDSIINTYNNKANLVKIVTTANTPLDCANILSLYIKHTNLIAFAMGDIGKITRLASLYLGAPFTYASIKDSKEVAKGQLSVSTLKKLAKLLSS